MLDIEMLLFYEMFGFSKFAILADFVCFVASKCFWQFVHFRNACDVGDFVILKRLEMLETKCRHFYKV